ncbi:RluA family pseudouridine synthase [Balneolaceae bacterium YR4-1]|uniref:RluA family pseudouridine synthase n=1 Tax=Halalkalibaculum roseum TaxID=2709311 RepID=A0A6M1SVP3_9BACT|nr:RluA family pseudouridine synthase [Halalkalibaculum roseum]NGP76196.1 RluA family pseudouridine synthase [Halalkalibaculum roseum]
MEHTETDPDIPIVYEDRHLLIIDKPHNLLSQEDHTGDADVLRLCKEYLNKQSSASGGSYLGLVQRLDRPVGGLMVLAKDSATARSLSKQISDRLVQKTYLAVVYGSPPANGVLTHYLLKDQQKNVVETASEKNKNAKKAVLSFAKLLEVDHLSLLSIHLQTGRPHQIRVQLSEEGYPIWGDYKYGTQNKPDGRTIALRASELIFKHPKTQKEMHFELPPPEEHPWNRFSN